MAREKLSRAELLDRLDQANAALLRMQAPLRDAWSMSHERVTEIINRDRTDIRKLKRKRAGYVRRLAEKDHA